MKIEHELEYCYITDQRINPIRSGGGTKSYSVDFGGNTWEFRFFRYYKDTPYINDNKHIFKGLLINNKWPLKRLDVIKTEVLETIIRTGFYPKTPSEKLNNLLLFLYEIQKNIGEIIDIDSKISHDILIPKLYFKSHNEFYFYLETLKNQDYIDGMEATSKYGPDLAGIKITYQGLQQIIQIQEEGKTSNNCFIAMSFSDDVRDIRESIKLACKETGFIPILIDEVHFESEDTINDAIIAYLKKSKFCIADFTKQKDGVYFEAGYALGKGLQVIYTCRNDWFEKSHFDTNHFPHIIYDTPEELKNKLIKKIEARIL